MYRRRFVHSVRLFAASVLTIVVGTLPLAQASSAAEMLSNGANSPAENLLNDRFVVSLGGFVVSSKINGSLSGNASLTVDTPMGPVEQAATFTTKSSSVPAPLPVVGGLGGFPARVPRCLRTGVRSRLSGDRRQLV
jgi:hypothetical protein